MVRIFLNLGPYVRERGFERIHMQLKGKKTRFQKTSRSSGAHSEPERAERV